jgi:hypothetical protein
MISIYILSEQDLYSLVSNLNIIYFEGESIKISAQVDQ